MRIAAVIPVRNRPILLRRAVLSVQAQTSAIDEIIIVDDASTDETPNVALAFAQKDARIRVIRLPSRKGPGAARNVAWRSTDADWIAFLDSDDEWLPEKIERQIPLITDNVVGSFTGYILKVGGWRNSPPSHVDLFDIQRSNVLGTPSTAIISRAALEQIGGFDEIIPSCSDWDCWIKLRMLGCISVVAEPLIYFEQAGSDRITKNFPAILAGHKIMFKRILENVEGIVPRLRVRAYHKGRLAQLLLDDFGRPGSAIILCFRSLASWPNGYALNTFQRSAALILRHCRPTLDAKKNARIPGL